MLLLFGAYFLYLGIRKGLAVTPWLGVLLLVGGGGIWFRRFWAGPFAAFALLAMAALQGWSMHRSTFSWITLVSIVCMIWFAWQVWQEHWKKDESPSESPDAPRSGLARALKQGLEPGGNLSEALRQLGDYKIRSTSDAEAICVALERIIDGPPAKSRYDSSLRTLASLFQDIEGGDPYEVLSERGVPLLLRRFDARMKIAGEEEAGELMLVLKILVLYGSHEGAERLVRAARLPLQPEDYLWHVIFKILAQGHPERDYVFGELRDPIPPAFIAVSLVDAANEAAIEGKLEVHPFDSPSGKARLREWLASTDPDHYSYAHSATAALLFIGRPERDSLFALAMDHVDAGVQLEACWASAKLGNETGLEALRRACLEVHQSATARRYLTELHREDLIPGDALDPDFTARADFSSWLAHPNELGRVPDEVETVDARDFHWPPDREKKRCSILRYRAKATDPLQEDDVNCGMVGSVTFCLFSYKMHLRPPDDVYAIHCAWEVSQHGLIEVSAAEDPAEYANLLQQWTGKPLQGPNVLPVAELSPKLGHDRQVVALASASIDGEEGWVVLDGPKSQWYPKADLPEKVAGSTVLDLHIGRSLLGFSEQPDRKLWLSRRPKKRDPAEFARAYEGVLAQAKVHPNPSLKVHLGSLGHFLQAYDEACVAARAEPQGRALARAYEELLALSQSNLQTLGDKALDRHSPLGENLESYAKVLLAAGDLSKIVSLVELFAPHWDHNLGYGELGTLAFKAGRIDRAEGFFIKLRESLEEWYRCEEMGLLARIWCGRKKQDDAKQLLVGCLTGLVKKNQALRGSDRRLYEAAFQEHRKTFLELFPEAGDAGLARLGVPKSTLGAS
jgi:hypothetical protein